MPTPPNPQDASRTAYQRYIDENTQASKSWSGEGNMPDPQTYEQWMTDQSKAAKWGYEHGYDTVDPSTLGVALREDDPLIAQFKEKYGTRDYAPVELQNKALTGYEVISPDDVEKLKEWGTDLSRLMDLGDGRYLMERANRSGEAIAAAQAKDADSGYWHGDWMDVLKGPGLVIGGGMLGNAIMGGSLGAGSLGGTMPEALGGAGGVTQYPVGSVGGMGGSGFGSTVGEFAQGIRNSIPDFSNPFNSSPGGGGSGASGAGGTSGGNMFDPVNALNSGGGNVPSGSGSWMNVARRMPWGDIIRGAGNIIGGNSQGSMNEAGERERQYNEQMWMRALMANSPNQTTDFGTSTWEVDPVTGRRSQTLRMNERDAARLGQFRDIASGRMNDAGKLLQLDWNKINPQVAQMMQGVSFGGNQLRGG